MDVRRVIGANVRRLRLAADLSQEQVAERMGVDRAYISALELGRRNPTAVTLWLISEALAVEIVALFEEAAEKPSGRQRATKR